MLKIDYCSHDAAKYAVENWHYSKSMPAGKTYKLGVWENDKFIGCVIFSLGANNNAPKEFNLTSQELCELTRVALNKHITPVTRILAIALRKLKLDNQGLKMLVSYADSNQNHHGGIYAGGGWQYNGVIKSQPYFIVNGKQTHGRTITSKFGHLRLNELRERGISIIEKPALPKHKYVFFLCNKTKEKWKHLSKPYPKREKQAMA
jgi:hypothetical protein